MAGRITMSPVQMNVSLSSPGSFGSAAPAAGVDAAGTGGTSFATAWGANSGVQFQNGTGTLWLWYYNGATACTASYLIGQKSGGDVFPYTEEQVVMLTSGYGWLGPWSPQKYNQQDTSQFSAAPGGVIGTTGQGLTCIDFSATTTVALRLFNITPQLP